jgi:hypothetical protein
MRVLAQHNERLNGEDLKHFMKKFERFTEEE